MDYGRWGYRRTLMAMTATTTFYGEGGTDFIWGGNGDDNLYGGNGGDAYTGR